MDPLDPDLLPLRSSEVFDPAQCGTSTTRRRRRMQRRAGSEEREAVEEQRKARGWLGGERGGGEGLFVPPAEFPSRALMCNPTPGLRSTQDISPIIEVIPRGSPLLEVRQDTLLRTHSRAA
ncbi:hypothetical protein WMY93_013421 [Mugilogobius chulae]|uniref:Uncharacterized protein n=1 Tax=Mugilogobius chulae TaxID=88201 RepID=A0AAW0P3K4_9GOBI